MPYDHGSIMHYAGSDGSANDLPAIESLDPAYQRNMGQRRAISFNDAKIINRAYCQGATARGASQLTGLLVCFLMVTLVVVFGEWRGTSSLLRVSLLTRPLV